jgi:hypothetical protein
LCRIFGDARVHTPSARLHRESMAFPLFVIAEHSSLEKPKLSVPFEPTFEPL